MFVLAVACARSSAEVDTPVAPGAPVLARWNRAEYDAVVHDLLGTTKTPGRMFPTDESSHGFDNVGATLTTTSLHVEAWEAAAVDLVDELFGTDPEVPSALRVEAEGPGVSYVGDGTLMGNGTTWGMLSGGLVTTVVVAGDGWFEIRVQALGHELDGEAPRIVLQVDERFAGAIDAPTGDEQQMVSLPVMLTEGAHRIEVGLGNPERIPGVGGRSLAIDWVEVYGPTDPEGAPTPAYAAFVPCAAIDRSCAGAAIGRFGYAAWRRPLTDADVDWGLALYDVATTSGESPTGALALVFRAILLSPDFLFTVEPAPTAGHDVRRLDDLEVASRLAAFLWSSVPDGELLAEGMLSALDDDELGHQVDRMLADPRAQALVDNFAGQWLDLRDLDVVTPDRTVYPAFDEALRASMRGQLALVADDFVKGRTDLVGLLLSDEMWVDERLAEELGVPWDGPDDGWVEVTTGDGRMGLLGTPGWLTTHAHPDRPSAVQRGKWVLENLLCSAPPPPPPDVDTVLTLVPGGGSTREQEEALRADPYCQACHASMDGVGFVFHGFDAIGAPRTVDELGFPIDSSTVLDGTALDGPADLAAWVAGDPRLPACVATQTLTYALGRPMTSADQSTIDDVTAAFLAGGLRFDALAKAVATSDAFRYRGRTP